MDIFVFPFHCWCCFPLYCMLPPLLVVVDGPFMLGPFSWMLISGSSQIILSILLLWLIPWHLSLFYILHELVHFMGIFLVLVCWIFFLGKNTHLICFVPLVLICRMHQNICGEWFCFFCILLLCMDVSRCNLKIELFFLWFKFLVLSIPLSAFSATRIVGSMALA